MNGSCFISFDFSLFGAALLLSAIGLWFTVTIPWVDHWNRRFFTGYFIIFMLCVLASIMETAFQYFKVPDGLFCFLLFCETLLLSLPPPMVTFYLLHCCPKDFRSDRLIHTVLGLWAFLFVLMIILPFSNAFIYLTPGNQYYRGSLYPFLLAPMIIILLINFAGTIRRRKELSRRAFLSLVIAQVPMIITLTMQMFISVISLVDISYVVSALAMYSLMLSDQIEQDLRHQQEIARQEREIARQEREIAHERASVMVLQMRPHFIFNTLMSIYSLCELDPRKAQQVTIDFTNYLRKNFNAVASASPIPFSAELEHTRTYLAVEQANLDDMLVVHYDVQFTQFRLPPLTLQPIAENAVKHGLDPNSGPLCVTIRTQLTDLGARIIVEDNGSGFDPSDESKKYVTLTNIQNRLKLMCGGSMTIHSQDGKGTVVDITIPPSHIVSD